MIFECHRGLFYIRARFHVIENDKSGLNIGNSKAVFAQESDEYDLARQTHGDAGSEMLSVYLTYDATLL